MNYASARDLAEQIGGTVFLDMEGDFSLENSVYSIWIETYDKNGEQRYVISSKALLYLTRYATNEQARIMRWLSKILD